MIFDSVAIVLVELGESVTTSAINSSQVRKVHVLLLLVDLKGFLVFAQACLETLLLNLSALGTAKVERARAVSVGHLSELVPSELLHGHGVLGVVQVGGVHGLGNNWLARVLSQVVSYLSHF